MAPNEAAALISSSDRQYDLLVEVYAVWCHKCLALKPVLEAMARHCDTSSEDVKLRVLALDGVKANAQVHVEVHIFFCHLLLLCPRLPQSC